MTQVFVVMLTIGHYEDALTTAHKVFIGGDESGRGDWRARSCVENGNRLVAEVNGMLRSLNAMMEVWEKAHPHPLDGKDFGYRSSEEEDDTCERWRLRRDAERQTLFDAMGIVEAMKEANVPEHDRDIYTPHVYMRYYIAENVEVVSY